MSLCLIPIVTSPQIKRYRQLETADVRKGRLSLVETGGCDRKETIPSGAHSGNSLIAEVGPLRMFDAILFGG